MWVLLSGSEQCKLNLAVLFLVGFKLGNDTVDGRNPAPVDR